MEVYSLEDEDCAELFLTQSSSQINYDIGLNDKEKVDEECKMGEVISGMENVTVPFYEDIWMTKTCLRRICGITLSKFNKIFVSIN